MSKKPQTRRSRRASTSDYSAPNLIELSSYQHSPKQKTVNLIPRSRNQEDYVLALEDSNLPIVFAVGPAGCGKTMLATQAAIKGLKEGLYEKVVITRPNVAVDDNDIGYLPGDVLEKMTPWMLPILDVFAEYYPQKEITHMLEEKIIEIAPVAYLRGRTFKRSIVLVDEAQGLTTTSMKAVLTRIGENSKMIVTGDLDQSDRGMENGLRDFLSRVEGKEAAGIGVIRFGHHNIERHSVITTVLKLYGEE